MKLNIGANNTRIKGFKNLDILPNKNIDIVCDARSLKQFKDNSVAEIVASHILEHFSHTETENILKEWYRILKPKKTLYLAVPDWDMIAKLYYQIGLNDWLIKFVYGDQNNKYAYHYTGFNYSNLLFLLDKTGFKEIQKIVNLPYDVHCSNLIFNFTNENVSLNVKAIK